MTGTAPAGLYVRLNEIGHYYLTDAHRFKCGELAAILRRCHARLSVDLKGEDDLLEIADRLDTLASPILAVERTS